MVYNGARQFPATGVQQEAFITKEDTMKSKVQKALYRRDDETKDWGHIIDYQGKKWLVPGWCSAGERAFRPVRIICLYPDWPFGESTAVKNADVVIERPLSREILEGLSEDPRVIESPDIVLNEEDIFGK
jgi:hypothetical protein